MKNTICQTKYGILCNGMWNKQMSIYPNCVFLMISTVRGGSVGGLGWRGVLKETIRLYLEYFGKNGKIPVTYTVLYVAS